MIVPNVRRPKMAEIRQRSAPLQRARQAVLMGLGNTVARAVESGVRFIDGTRAGRKAIAYSRDEPSDQE